MPKLCPIEEEEEDEDEDVSADDAEDAGGTALDTTDANPMPKGSPICVIDACGKHSSYGPIDGKRNSAFLCSTHGKKHGGCENMKAKRCEAHQCKRVPSFGKPGGLPKTATCCANHGIPKGYVDLVHPRCEYANCVIIATFGPRGGKAARCDDHREPHDIDLRNKKCEEPNCDDRAYYGQRGGKVARCGQHKKADDIDRHNKLCAHSDCDDRAYYGPHGGKVARCEQHREKDDVNLVHKLCEQPNCDDRAYYGPRGGKVARCEQHKKADDVGLVYPICEGPNCDKHASFGKPGGKRARCEQHSEPDDINLVNKICEGPNCPTVASLGLPDGRRQFCIDHATHGVHIDVSHPRCASCPPSERKFIHPLSKVSKCIDCDPALVHHTRTKEKAVKKAGEDVFGKAFQRECHIPFTEFGIGVDRTECGMQPQTYARLDFVIEKDGVVVVIEVDEHQHQTYCGEIARVNEVAAYLLLTKNNKYVHFIRFNPDAFKINQQRGKVPMKTRHARLMEKIKAVLESPAPQEKLWNLQHMYYDTQDGQVCIMDEIHPMIQAICLPPIIA